MAGLVATALVALGAAATLPAEPVPFSFVSFGWFQPALLAGATVPLLALAIWRAPTARRRALWALLAALGLAVALPNARRVLESVFRGGAYVFKGGAGARGGRLRGRRLPLLPTRVPPPRRRVPAARARMALVRARGARGVSGLSARAGRGIPLAPGGIPAAAQASGRGAPPPCLLRRGRVRDGPLPAAQRLLPRDLRRARARRAPRADRAAPAPSAREDGAPDRSRRVPRRPAGCSVPRAGAGLRGRARVRRPRPLRAAPRAGSASRGSVGRAAAGPRRDPGRHAALVRRALRDGDRRAAVRRRSRSSTAGAGSAGSSRRRTTPKLSRSCPRRSAGISSRRTSRRCFPPTRPPPAARPRPPRTCSRGGCTSRMRRARRRSSCGSSTRERADGAPTGPSSRASGSFASSARRHPRIAGKCRFRESGSPS